MVPTSPPPPMLLPVVMSCTVTEGFNMASVDVWPQRKGSGGRHASEKYMHRGAFLAGNHADDHPRGDPTSFIQVVSTLLYGLSTAPTLSPISASLLQPPRVKSDGGEPCEQTPTHRTSMADAGDQIEAGRCHVVMEMAGFAEPTLV